MYKDYTNTMFVFNIVQLSCLLPQYSKPKSDFLYGEKYLMNKQLWFSLQ